jgi:hypothetical protein
MFLDRSCEWQTDSAPFGILPKIRQDFSVERNAYFLRPPFHLGMIVCELRNIEADAGKKTPRVPVCQRGQGGQAFRKCKGLRQSSTAVVTIKSLGQGTLIRAGQLHDFIGLTVLSRGGQASGRFRYAAEAE